MEEIDIQAIEIEAITQIPPTPKLRQQKRMTAFLCSIYTIFLFGFLCIFLLIPSAPSSSMIYNTLYFTNSFEPFKLIYFYFLTTTGMIYVNSVTLKNYLRLIKRQTEKKSDFFIFLSVGFLLFVLGPNATMKAYSSEISYLYAVFYNFVCFTVPYVVSLHITYIYSGVLFKVSISANEV